MISLSTPINAVGKRALAFFEFVGGMGLLVIDTIRATRQGLLAKKGRKLGWENLWAQMVRVGVKSVPIVSLVLLCVGSILALQMAPTLRNFGLVQTVADIIAIAVFRELGPLVGAIVLTGFAGASIAAEIGTMVVSEEVEALEAIAISPIRFLVVPRMIATIVMMICLAVVADVMGILGGLIMSTSVLKISFSQYMQRTQAILELKDFFTGLIKAGVFGMIISGFACHLGLRVSGGAAGVGVATTRTVVFTIVALIAVDLLFTAGFYFVGL